MAKSNHTIASISHISKSFGSKKVLSNITINICEGQILGLIGPSGSGKTTTIKCLLGMERADTGLATIFGQKMPNRQILERIGYMGQTDALYENLTALENLTFFGNLMGISGAELTSTIDKNMALVNLTDSLHQIVANFSGGMKRRLSLAIALLANPDLIILDEPTVGIDPSLRLDIWTQLRTLAIAQKAIIVTTHVMDEAEKCDLVGLIINGEIFALGTPSELKEKFHATSIEEVFLKAEVSSK
ncbi:ABC transporter ATP-binding protein [Liquorilactobacillus mali]|uniref:ABC transporter ecsA-like protein n=1 Tax=Liquorilactobacillus mali KCTC 3596 = DSM 20444 TaxID=1046596 RepID=J0UPS9_9LACO|nr:ABC transporter ATP-binding protein [Liquorilactobacillus mali]EJE97559.1 ABC transporter ecsA-like protein [Liquorilactobacillus mali KCTC 3596 = DSM 20444]KRN08857.1 ABC transporter ecsA-like protein [Liquorilactobacillus mali KCTC 3596 = DSM 20444]MDC7952974.1 ABC transporter ATP-binding protein [Liquorilactobacillus mali]MDV7758807.1 ATP-binding cassette domain-containing protein [Liquorilactobacillus mali]QFQ73978.1 ABC transporter ATP-binding protein [Liquorilactobacillus mali]